MHLLYKVLCRQFSPLLLLRDKQAHQTVRQTGSKAGWVCQWLLQQSLGGVRPCDCDELVQLALRGKHNWLALLPLSYNLRSEHKTVAFLWRLQRAEGEEGIGLPFTLCVSVSLCMSVRVSVCACLCA